MTARFQFTPEEGHGRFVAKNLSQGEYSACCNIFYKKKLFLGLFLHLKTQTDQKFYL